MKKISPIEQNDFYQLDITGAALEYILNKAGMAINQNSIVDIEHGGTGVSSLPKDAILIGKGGAPIQGSTISNGVFYKADDEENPSFKPTLPIKYGGTGVKSLSELRAALISKNEPLSIVEGGTGATSLKDGLAYVNGQQINTLTGANKQILMANDKGLPVYQDQNTITSVGTITLGTWRGDVIEVEKGGTGVSSLNDLRNRLGIKGEVIESIPIDSGGTGATTAKGARENLGITPANIGAVATTDIIDIKHGGTGADTAENARNSLGITPANIGAVATTDIIDIAHGGTGASTAEVAILNLFSDAPPLNEFNGGTGTNSFQSALSNYKVITENNLTKSIVSDTITITDTNFSANQYQLSIQDCGKLYIVKGTKSVTLILPDFSSSSDNKYELEVFKFTSQDVYIQSNVSNEKCYYAGASAPSNTVKISDNYGSIGIKRIPGGWIITGGVQTP